MAESEEELKSPLMKVKEKSKKKWLKLIISKTKIMASGPITSWQIDGEKIGTVTDFIFLSSKITADSDCSHKIKMLAPWKKSYDQHRQHIKKQRHYFAKVRLVKAMVFPVVMYGCETVKVKVKSISRVWLFATPAYQAPPSMGFSRQECWSGLPFPSPRDLSNPGIEPK